MIKKWIILIAAFILGICHHSVSNAQFIQNNSRSLFSDVKAFKVGDAVMVYIAEETSANNSASTTAGRSSDLSAGLDLNTGSSPTSIDLGLKTGNNFRGNGGTTRSERIKSKLSAQVIEVMANGDMRIKGMRTTKINGEEQKISIEGIVRKVDIASDNSVYSYNILDLTLKIEGNGTISEVQEPGLITKFLRMLF